MADQHDTVCVLLSPADLDTIIAAMAIFQKAVMRSLPGAEDAAEDPRSRGAVVPLRAVATPQLAAPEVRSQVLPGI